MSQAHGPAWLRAGLDDPYQGGALIRRKRRRFARRLAVDEPVRTLGFEAQDPIPHDPRSDPADPGSLRPTSAVTDHSKRQKPPDLLRIPALACQSPQFITGKVASKLDRRRHGNPNLFSMMNHTGRACRSPSGFSISEGWERSVTANK